MNKILSGLIVSGLMSLSALASQGHTEGHESQPRTYVAIKAMYTLGKEVQEEASSLNGEKGHGIGIDLGYKLGNDFSIEIDATYAEDSILETKDTGEKENLSAIYLTSSLDVAYTHLITHEIGLFAKVGIEYELETIRNTDKLSNGLIFATGAEYELDETFALIAEYEISTINSPRGNSIYSGLVYHF